MTDKHNTSAKPIRVMTSLHKQLTDRQTSKKEKHTKQLTDKLLWAIKTNEKGTSKNENN